MSVTREKLLAAKIDFPQEVVDVPEMGGKVTVKGMSGKDLSAFYKSVRKGKTLEVDEETFNARLVASSLVDSNGKRLLKDEEFTVAQEWPGQIFNKLLTASMRVNGLIGGN
jgi:hypothetical protein